MILALGLACTPVVVLAAGPSADDTKAVKGGLGEAVAVPQVADEKPIDLPGLHNIVAFHEGFYSGSVPEGETGFESLAKLGVRTVVSVDGAIPDVAAARARGMRYAHLPIGYDGFDDARRAELVRAVRDLPRPIYLHCHHGKHRSAGAAATVAVSLGWLANDAAAARMRVSGTAAGYKGLWACAANAAPMLAAAIDAARADFPEITVPDSMVSGMIAIDETHERLRTVEKNAWRVPPSHPDLAPAADAGKLADLLALLNDDAFVHALEGGECATRDGKSDSARVGANDARPSAVVDGAKADGGGPAGGSRAQDFRALLAAGRAAASELEDVLAGAPPTIGAGPAPDDEPSVARARRLTELLGRVSANCNECHARHRD